MCKNGMITCRVQGLRSCHICRYIGSDRAAVRGRGDHSGSRQLERARLDRWILHRRQDPQDGQQSDREDGKALQANATARLHWHAGLYSVTR